MNYLIETLSAATPEYFRGRLRLARYLATERMEYLLGEAQQAWKSPEVQRKTVQSIQVGDGPVKTKVLRHTGPDARFLVASARLNIMNVKLVRDLYEPLCPPEEDCSAAARKRPRVAAAKESVSASGETHCDDDGAGGGDVKSPATDPAQSPPDRKLTRAQKRARREFLGQAS